MKRNGNRGWPSRSTFLGMTGPGGLEFVAASTAGRLFGFGVNCCYAGPVPDI